MVCNECGAKVPPGVAACPECGAATSEGAAPSKAKPGRPQAGTPRARPTARAERRGFPWATAIVSFGLGLVVGYVVFGGKEEPASRPSPHGMMGGMGSGKSSAPPLPSDLDMSKLPPGHPDVGKMMMAVPEPSKARGEDASAPPDAGAGAGKGAAQPGGSKSEP